MDQSMQWLLDQPAVTPPLDENFRPPCLARTGACGGRWRTAGGGVPLAIAVEAAGGGVPVSARASCRMAIPGRPANLAYAERILKFLLWQRGGWRVVIAGPSALGAALQRAYAPDGPRQFDARLMADLTSHLPWKLAEFERLPDDAMQSRRWAGTWMKLAASGLTWAASDHKEVAAVMDGKPVFSESNLGPQGACRSAISF